MSGQEWRSDIESDSSTDPGGTYIIRGEWRADGDITPFVHSAYSGEDEPGADLVIQTADSVLFHIHSYHLKAAR